MIHFCSSYTCAERSDIELPYTPEMTYFPTDTAEGIKKIFGNYLVESNKYDLSLTNVLSFIITVQANIDPSEIKVEVVGTNICVSYRILELCFESKLQGIAITSARQQLDSFSYCFQNHRTES